MNPVSEGHGARGKVVKAFSVFKGSKQRKKKALCKEGDEGGMGSVLISERNLVHMHFPEGREPS